MESTRFMDLNCEVDTKWMWFCSADRRSTNGGFELLLFRDMLQRSLLPAILTTEERQLV